LEEVLALCVPLDVPEEFLTCDLLLLTLGLDCVLLGCEATLDEDRAGAVCFTCRCAGADCLTWPR
jgi:hypothetical protein